MHSLWLKVKLTLLNVKLPVLYICFSPVFTFTKSEYQKKTYDGNKICNVMVDIFYLPAFLDEENKPKSEKCELARF